MTLMTLVTLVLVLALVGFLIYLAVTYIPMPEPFKQALVVVCVIGVILFLISTVRGSVPLLR